MKQLVLNNILENIGHGRKQLAVLIDPDSLEGTEQLIHTCQLCTLAGVDLILVGGSLITNGFFEESIRVIKSHTSIPVVLFPGNIMQIDANADAILLLSLISGRNADMLIGKHVLAAPTLKKSGIEIMPTGYMLIDGGNITSVSYMSNTTPIPADKNSIAACTAMAGEMLGLKIIYMDAGSGAKNPIPTALIKEVKNNIHIPLFVGGGMRTPEEVKAACVAGADIVVVGNAIEKDSSLIASLVAAVKS
ncbi:MAG: geranylgeranylglyceryl/heptaprenylglyceryl phosphate synthase [Bacteroidia bacterium]|nr:geranylgeranylglyceryl/heptaprenylglyceryl phosphate synthase [Bacteroidia bacterium]